ncbi:MAG: peptide deformylase [Clostridia bacterium]|nr:peptide deformylase [Clostridia bacterium]MBR2944010.1 peptide deformylase [Clostridia bacterium]
MAVLKIVTEEENEEFLRKKSREVTEITPRIKTLLDDMVETMRHANGCGLAAVQVGVLRRIVVIETGEGLFEFINPVIIRKTGTQEGAEGCLSLPGKWGMTKRPQCVTVRALDRDGNEIEVTGYDLLAKAMCHEIDHLDGILYTDKVTRMLGADEVE